MLNKICAGLHEAADEAEDADGHLGLMMRQVCDGVVTRSVADSIEVEPASV
jgi:hypothetical protein